MLRRDPSAEDQEPATGRNYPSGDASDSHKISELAYRIWVKRVVQMDHQTKIGFTLKKNCRIVKRRWSSL